MTKQDPIPARLAALKATSTPDLKSQWRDLFDSEPPPFNRRYLETRLAYRITSSILPPCLRKTGSVAELLPWLYLKGLSTGDFQDALVALPGPNAAGLSSTTISRLKGDWWQDYERWQQRDLSTRRIVHVWADGVCFQPRMEEKQCVLGMIGADEWERKEILGLTDGDRESTRSWRELLLDLKRRGLSHAPDLAIGDGVPGFRGAWIPGRPARSVWIDGQTALLVAQNRQCPQCHAQIRAGQSQGPPA